MKRNRDFHRQVRVVYRACRRLYGIDKTQDECLIVFKIVFPDYYLASRCEEKFYKLSDKALERLAALFDKWKPEFELKRLCEKVLLDASKLMERKELQTFCNDILAVVMRIRKLTPTETGRLMGLSDEEIQKMYDSGLSNSSLYKLHGNSIVVDVMTAVFDKLFINTDQEKEIGTQLTLF